MNEIRMLSKIMGFKVPLDGFLMVAKNKHYKEKIRQKLQRFFPKVEKGVYALFNQPS